jgi:hypothetical protein
MAILFIGGNYLIPVDADITGEVEAYNIETSPKVIEEGLEAAGGSGRFPPTEEAEFRGWKRLT